MYLILLQYIRPLAAVEHYLEAHNAFLDKFYKSGNFIVSGRRAPRTGGIILCRAENRRAVEKIILSRRTTRRRRSIMEVR